MANPIIEDILEIGSVDEMTGKKVLELLIALREQLCGKKLIRSNSSV
jgi:hypothetical protein